MVTDILALAVVCNYILINDMRMNHMKMLFAKFIIGFFLLLLLGIVSCAIFQHFIIKAVEVLYYY